MTRKEQIYFLLRGYYNYQYDESSFCEQFIPIYSDNVTDAECSKDELELFEFVCRLAARYSPYEEDRSLSQYFINEELFRDLLTKEINKYPFICNELRQS